MALEMEERAMQVQDGSVYARLCAERLADIAGVPGRRTKPQTEYVWPLSPDAVMGSVAKAMRDQPTDVPLHVLGVLPAWVLSLLALRGDWTEVWVCHVEDGSPWMYVSVPGYNDHELPTITGTTWAPPTNPLHLWTLSTVRFGRGRLTGTKMQRGRLEGLTEQHGMNTCVPIVRPSTTGALFISCLEQDSVPQVQQQIMVTRAAWAYSRPGDHQAKLVAVECDSHEYVVVHSKRDDYGVGTVIRTP